MPPPTDPDADGRLTPGATVQLDEAALDALRALDPDGRQQVLRRVLQTYDSSARRLLGALSDACAQADWAAAERIVHTLKSSSASVGALDFARRCAALEHGLRAGDRSRMAGELASLRDDGDHVLAAVRAMLRTA